MSLELTFICALEHGLHARPASVLAAAVHTVDARVTITRTVSGRSADARSVLSIVALDVVQGDECIIRADGPDAESALGALKALIDDGLAEIEAAALKQDASVGTNCSVPAGLHRLGVRSILGRGICPGFGQGPAVVIRSLGVPRIDRASRGLRREQEAARRAVDQVRSALAMRYENSADGLERDLLRAHLGIADDPSLRQKIDDAISSGQSAAASVGEAAAHFAAALRSAQSMYVRDRAVDVEDVCQQILEHLGVGEGAADICLQRPSVVIADILTPRQMMQMDRQKVRGLVLGRVGATSHTAILARAFGIPAVVDVHDVQSAFRDGAEVIVDAGGGFVLPEITEDVRRYYAIGERATRRRRERLTPYIDAVARTRDGKRLEMAANISSADEVKAAVNNGAEGIGLFRTEMLFLDRPAPPDEEEQAVAYAKAVLDAGGRTVIFRTFDIGGDKPAPYLRLPREDNPFLGWRGIRLYERFAALFRSQLRAIVRASQHGPIKIMAPMVANLREAQWFVDRVREVREELAQSGQNIAASIPLGVMVEVPSATIIIDQLAGVVDFFSIGTNDLAQYYMAADRGNPNVAALCDPMAPAFVRVLKSVTDAAKRSHKWIGICGEMAGEVQQLPIMIGLGVDEISVSSGGGNGSVLELKAALAGLEGRTCGLLVEQIIAANDPAEVRGILAECAMTVGNAPIIDAELVVIDADARTKIEAIHELVCLVATAGRTGDAQAVENAVWAREDTYSTGLGFGFAIPHCKSNAVRVPTIAVLRPARPIDWGSTDGVPARVVMLLAIPAGGSEASAENDISRQAARMHMQLLARLSRKLMHEEFRDQMLQADSPEALVTAVRSSLDQ